MTDNDTMHPNHILHDMLVFMVSWDSLQVTILTTAAKQVILQLHQEYIQESVVTTKYVKCTFSS
jgi:hypothetical protein